MSASRRLSRARNLAALLFSVVVIASCQTDLETSTRLYRADTLTHYAIVRGDTDAARAALAAILYEAPPPRSAYDSAAYALLYARAGLIAAGESKRRYHRAAYGFLHLLPDTLRADRLRAYGSAAHRGGDTPSARAYYAEAYILARSLRDSARTACADSLMLMVGPGEIVAPGASQGVQNGRMPLVTLVLLLVLSWVWFWLEHIKSQIARRAPR